MVEAGMVATFLFDTLLQTNSASTLPVFLTQLFGNIFILNFPLSYNQSP